MNFLFAFSMSLIMELGVNLINELIKSVAHTAARIKVFYAWFVVVVPLKFISSHLVAAYRISGKGWF